MSSSASKAQAAAVATFLRMPMIDETDRHGGLARAALALTTAIANEVRKRAISHEPARTVFKTARWLAHDLESFAENARTAEAADNFLTVSEAVVRHKFDQGEVRHLSAACRSCQPRRDEHRAAPGISVARWCLYGSAF
jgi:hypothetical protein